MAYSETNKKAVSRYVKEHYARLAVTIPIAQKQAVEEYAEQHGESINSLINRLLMTELKIPKNEWRRQDMSMMTEEQREAKLRRRLKAKGFSLIKSRIRTHTTIDNWGGYMIVNTYFGSIEAGERFNLSLDDVQNWLDDE